MKDLFFSSLSEHIGLTLLHSLWQGMIGVVLIIIVSRVVAAKYSTLRYWLFVAVMLSVFSVNIFTLINQVTVFNSGQETQLANRLTESLGAIQLKDAVESISLVNGVWLENILLAIPYFVMLWWIGIVALFIKMIINLWQIRKITRANHLPVSPQVLEIFETLRQQLKINKIVKIVQSQKISVPSVIGHLKPIIILPIGLVNGLTSEQVEAILLHELSHIKRHDFLVNIIQSVVEVIYFFNPFMWIISKTIRDEREHASDDDAISLGISASVYAETLAGVFNYAIKRQQFALSFASKNKLTLKRIQRIMKNKSNNNNKLIASMIFVIAITLSMYYGAESHAPGQDFSEMFPNRTVMATVLPSFSSMSTPMLEPISDEPVFREIIVPERIVKADTTDPKDLKKRTEAYEQAMKNLKSTKEWKEAEKIREEMVDEHMKIMTDISPQMEEALRIVEKSVKLSDEQLEMMEEKLARLDEELADIRIDEELERVMEINSRVLEESMRQIQDQMEDMNFDEITEMAELLADDAKKMAVEAKVMAAEAEKMAAEAELQVKGVEDFLDDLRPMLIDDGYIKSSKDLDQLKFKEGEVYINGEKVMEKDAKKYIKLHDKYFDSDDGFIMN